MPIIVVPASIIITIHNGTYYLFTDGSYNYTATEMKLGTGKVHLYFNP